MTPLTCPKASKHKPGSPADNTWLNYVDMTIRKEWWHCCECGHNWNVQFALQRAQRIVGVTLPSLSADDIPLSAEREG